MTQKSLLAKNKKNKMKQSETFNVPINMAVETLKSLGSNYFSVFLYLPGI